MKNQNWNDTKITKTQIKKLIENDKMILILDHQNSTIKRSAYKIYVIFKNELVQVGYINAWGFGLSRSLAAFETFISLYGLGVRYLMDPPAKNKVPQRYREI